MKTLTLALTLAAVGVGALAQANTRTVLLTNRDNPGVTDQVPSLPSDIFRQPSAPGQDGGCFFQIYISPNGTWWGLSAILQGPTTSGVNSLFAGSRDNRSTFRNTFLQGGLAPFPTGVWTNLGAQGFQHAVNESGDNVYRVALTGGATTTAAPESIYRNATTGVVSELRKTGDAMPGVAGVTMQSFDAINLLGDGNTLAFRATAFGAGTTNTASAMIIGGSAVGIASGIGAGLNATMDAAASFPTPLAGEPSRKLLTSFANTFRVSPNGSHFVYQGGLQNTGTTVFNSQIYNGRVIVRQGGAVNGVTDTAASVGAGMAATVNNSGYITRFSLSTGVTAIDQTDVVYRNDVIMTRTGDPVATGSTELWSDDFPTNTTAQATFSNAVFNNFGETVIAGWTNSGDPFNDEVMVFNDRYKQIVVAREGDAIDLDGNGALDDNAFIEFFYANHMAVDDNLNVYYRVRLRDNTAQAIGQAFIRQRLPIQGDVYGSC